MEDKEIYVRVDILEEIVRELLFAVMTLNSGSNIEDVSHEIYTKKWADYDKNKQKGK